MLYLGHRISALLALPEIAGHLMMAERVSRFEKRRGGHNLSNNR